MEPVNAKELEDMLEQRRASIEKKISTLTGFSNLFPIPVATLSEIWNCCDQSRKDPEISLEEKNRQLDNCENMLQNIVASIKF